MTNGTTPAAAASIGAQVVEGVMKVEPMIATAAGMFVPGAAPIVAMVQPWLVLGAPFLERALNDISASNGGDMLNAFMELMQHVSKGQPNSPVLSGPTADPSAQGGA